MLYLATTIGVGVENSSEIKSYLFSILASLVSVLISWYIGGIRVARYVSVFSLITILLFTKQLWILDVISSHQLFIARSFILIYLIIIFIVYIFYKIQSPADLLTQQEWERAESEKEKRKDLEYMVANEKLTNDLLSEANLVKDELHIMESNWRSVLHDIVNDISHIKEEEIYDKVIQPYSDSIIQHLRGLEERLSYEIKSYTLNELYRLIEDKITNNSKLQNSPITFKIDGKEWDHSNRKLFIDKHKLWDIIRNIISNSMTAIDLKRISKTKKHERKSYSPVISIHFQSSLDKVAIRIKDNGGGVNTEVLKELYKTPVPSKKRHNHSTGQGTMLVKFFTDKMSIQVNVANISQPPDRGLQVSLIFNPETI